MKKTVFTLGIALLTAIGAWAQYFTVDNLKYRVTNKTAKTVEVDGYVTEPTGALTIPATVTYNEQTYTVTSIGIWAIKSCTALTAVTIPESVTSIGYAAFNTCTALTEITIPQNVTNIGDNVFGGCTALTQINVDAANTAYCSENGVLFNKDKTILSCYPAGKTETAYTLPNTVTTICRYAFSNSTVLAQINLPESLTEIKYNAFYYCRALTQINVEAANTAYASENGVLFNKDKTTLMRYPAAKPETTYNVPEGVTYISSEAFLDCALLTQINLPESLADFFNNIFRNCTALTQINVEAANTAYASENGVLFNKDKTTLICYPAAKTETTYTIPDGVTHIVEMAFHKSALEQITVSDDVTNIGYGAFHSSSALKKVTIGRGVTYINPYILNNCPALEEITVLAIEPPYAGLAFTEVSRDIPVYVPAESLRAYQTADKWNEFNNLQPIGSTAITFTVDNLIYVVTDETAHNVKLIGYETEPTGTLNIPATVTHEGTTYNVTTIGSWAFKSCTALTAVTIPEGVTNIESNAFFDCALTQVTLPSSVTTCGRYVFAECSALTQITLPDGLTSIGESVFENCSALTTVNIGSGLTTIGKYAFDECSALAQINVDEANTAFCSENGILFNKEKTTLICYPATKTETTYTVPATVTTIGNYAFAYAAALTQITLPGNLTSIENYAFWDCTALTQLTVLATIPPVAMEFAFSGVDEDIPVYVPAEALTDYQAADTWSEFTNLQGITINFTVDNLKYKIIAANTVEVTGYESGLAGEVNIPATVTYEGTTYNVTSIGDWVFYECNTITAVTIPDGVTSIRERAFEDCPALTTVTIPASVTSIGKKAFHACYALTEVTIPASVTSIGKQAFSFCKALTAINVADDNTAYCSENGVLFNKDKTTLLQYPVGNPATTYTIPASVTNIETTAFNYCKILTAINVADGNTAYSSENGVLFNKDKTTLLLYPIGNPATTYTVPATVTTIGEDAFAYCSVLTTVTIPNSVTGIGWTAFKSCSALTTVNMGSGLTNIENYAFYECKALTQMTILATVPPTIGTHAFYKVERDIPVYVPAEALTDYQAADTWSEFNLQALPASNLQTATMPESIRMEGGMLHNPQQLHMTLYDMQGRQVYSGNDATLSLTTGVYVVRCAGASCKVLF